MDDQMTIDRSAQPTADQDRWVVLRNRKSGNAKDEDEELDAAIAELGEVEVVELDPDSDLSGRARQAAKDGASVVVAAGGDGTAMAVARGLCGTGTAMGILPQGTFNFFARGLGLPEDRVEAARALRVASRSRLSLGAVEGEVFLNNVSFGIYPAILKDREEVYASWGRSRVAAYWSVIRTFMKAQRPLRATLTLDGVERKVVTPLIFVARSAYQLDHFNLPGIEAVRDDRMVVFVGKRTGKRGLFLQAWHLWRGSMQVGRDIEVLTARELTVKTDRPRVLVACDGEKARLQSPVHLTMKDDCLDVLIPATDSEETP